MFITFANIEKPNSLNNEDARRLHRELLLGTPTIEQTQAALKIQRGWEQGVDVILKEDERRAVVAVLNIWSGPGEQISGAARWVQQNMRRSLGEDVH
jgi:hypothetical protein